MTLPIYQVDAFASEPFTGNPAAVMPLSEWLPAETMQQIAMENNLAETAYIVAHQNNDVADYHIRWFTPTLEIDLCGHATLAAAFVLHTKLGYSKPLVRFSTEQAGLLEVAMSNSRYTLNFPERIPLPVTEPEGLVKALGLNSVREVRRSRDYFVVCNSEDEVLGLSPNFNALMAFDATGVIVTALGAGNVAVSRCFYPQAGINEDPVTGSAHCSIVPYWCQALNKSTINCRQASARGGYLHSEWKNGRVYMTGEAVLVMQGEFFI